MSSTAIVAGVVVASPVIATAGLIYGTVKLCQWINDNTQADIAAVGDLREQQRRERLLSPNAIPLGASLASATLQGSSEPLRRTAEKLGYSLVRPSSREPHILLARPTGERLAIGRNEEGQVTVLGKDKGQVRKLVQCHTIDRAIGHLRGKGMNVHAQTLPNGEVQIIGQEKQARKDGAAKVTTNFRSDGSMFIDVDNITSNRCGDIVKDLADATGGSITDMNSKGPHKLPVTNRRRVRF